MIEVRVPAALLAAVLLAAAPAFAQGASTLGANVDPGWLADPYWYQGEAEVNLYHATLVKYGVPRPADEVAHIVVTEKHDPELLVKADDWRRPDLLGVLKFNYVTSVRTGVYTYRQMLSFFFERDRLHLAKMTLASHDWCGNAFKELVNREGRESFTFNTYWDGEGSGSHAVDFPPELVVYESLPVQLRALRWRPGLRVTLDLLPSQLSSRARPPVAEAAELRVGAVESVTVPAGTFEAYPVSLRHAGGVDALWFEAAFPHRMLSWETASGDRFRLRASERLAYWALNRPGDEARLE